MDWQNRFVVQSFRPGASSGWHDEAWSRVPAEAEQYITDAKQRNPSLGWRLITRTGDPGFAQIDQEGGETMIGPIRPKHPAHCEACGDPAQPGQYCRECQAYFDRWASNPQWDRNPELPVGQYRTRSSSDIARCAFAEGLK